MPFLLYLANIFKQYTKTNSVFPTRKKITSNISKAKIEKKINPPAFYDSERWRGARCSGDRESGMKKQNITIKFCRFLEMFLSTFLKIKPLGGKENQTQIATNTLEVFKDIVFIVRESAVAFGSFNRHF